ncbi:uncharacterized protein TNCV_723751 [Trichonephila clavipes]|nr:uncharacterized protein TNCV_723751 [Trichonephila clavipes]
MLVVFVLSILEQSVLAIYDAGVVVQRYPIRSQLEKDLVISQAKDNHESAPAVTGNCSSDHDSRCRSSVSWPQIIWLQSLPCPPSDQHTAITGTKTKPAFIRKHNRYPLRPPKSSAKLKDVNFFG